MASAGFFAGMVTAGVLLGAGFVGGSLVARQMLEPAPEAAAAAVDRLPPARVVLPPLTAEAAAPASAPVETSAPTPAQPRPQLIPAKDDSSEKAAEKDKQTRSSADDDRQTKRADQRKEEAAERRKKRYAERKARRDAARAKQQQEQHLQQQHELMEAGAQQPSPPGIMAFDDEAQHPSTTGFFGN
jgi:hypothetical protein